MLTAKPRLPLKEILLVGLWPSALKKIIYRWRGYRIGPGVCLGIGSVITGTDVEIGRDAQVGFFTIIRSKTIRIGPHVQIGALTFFDTPHLELGEGTKINEQVFVGGLQFPDSRLIVGRNCQIMQKCFINPARSITIGDDTGIGGDSLLFGHSSWLSKFEGYPVEFDDIEIGRSVSISWRVFVLPGSRIGDGTIVGANSLVRGNIPGNCLAVGFPARVVSKPPELPAPVSDDEKAGYLREITAEMIDYLRGFDLPCTEKDGDWIVTRRTPRWLGTRVQRWSLRILTSNGDTLRQELTQSPIDVVVSLHPIPREIRSRLNSSGCAWIDIANKERSDRGNDLGEEVAMYLRRYGVRLLRDTTP